MTMGDGGRGARLPDLGIDIALSVAGIWGVWTSPYLFSPCGVTRLGVYGAVWGQTVKVRPTGVSWRLAEAAGCSVLLVALYDLALFFYSKRCAGAGRGPGRRRWLEHRCEQKRSTRRLLSLSLNSPPDTSRARKAERRAPARVSLAYATRIEGWTDARWAAPEGPRTQSGRGRTNYRVRCEQFARVVRTTGTTAGVAGTTQRPRLHYRCQL